ncbi:MULTISPECIES: hypothetical protein [Bacillus cereus group]|uniref:hypothetical protein n=1 Tax=Bacillus cereus group TaxID=86661 RepID=UPI00352B52F6
MNVRVVLNSHSLITENTLYSPDLPLTELYGKVILFFPNAKEITTEGYGVVGSVLHIKLIFSCHIDFFYA